MADSDLYKVQRRDSFESDFNPNYNASQSVEALLQDKESIIENLMLRYDIGVLAQDTQHKYKKSDEIDCYELHRKSWYLAKKTILENHYLREMVNELRHANFYLRNEIFELGK